MGEKEPPNLIDFELIELMKICERRDKLGLPNLFDLMFTATPEGYAKAFKKAGEMLRENGTQPNIGEDISGCDSEFCRRRREQLKAEKQGKE